MAVWKYEKFKGDAAIYAFCPKCGFHHNPSRMEQDENGRWSTEIKFQYKYCPMCAEPLFDKSGEVDVIWDERDITELYANEEIEKDG